MLFYALIEALDADRMQRAKQLGFDVDQVFYHATNQDFDAFDLRYNGASNTVGSDEPAIFLTSDPHTANSYVSTQYYAEYINGWTRERYQAAEERLHALWQTANKVTMLHGGMSREEMRQVRVDKEAAEQEADALQKEMANARRAAPWHAPGSQVMPLLIKTKRLLKLDMQGRGYSPDAMKHAMRRAKRAKKAGVMLMNFNDWGGAPGTRMRAQTTVAIFDPKDIRSLYAKFDPDHADDANLMA